MQVQRDGAVVQHAGGSLGDQGAGKAATAGMLSRPDGELVRKRVMPLDAHTGEEPAPSVEADEHAWAERA